MAKPLSSILFHWLIFFFFFSSSSSFPSSNALYNVLHFGAKPDGNSDSTRPFLRAWAMACDSWKPTTIYVPHGQYLINSIVFYGPCRNTMIEFRIDGTLVAPPYYNKLASTGKWISFNNVDGVTITGGKLNGRGAALWACKAAGGSCPFGATSLTFSNSKNIVISGLTSMDSEVFHMVILGCQAVKVIGVDVVAPGNSPNTDGIHVQMSTGVTIGQTSIRTGDDCISVGPGTSGLWIDHIFCGPGHGISIGSLGKGKGFYEKGVENVTVDTVFFSGTQNGLRIKTWGTPKSGYVKGVVFQNAIMQNVQNPIIIDQNYCPHDRGCPDQNSHIRISQVKYMNIRGSSATPIAMKFDCSPSNPCNGIRLQDIKLTYHNQPALSSCRHAFGATNGFTVPPSCL